ncbi:MAG: TspO/MBR family protein [Candidatus Diapherotrites archaeon]
MEIKDIVKLVAAILVSQAAGIIGSVFTFSSIPTWYAILDKPFFSPPNWVFGPVWIILYTLIGISAYLIWKKGLEKSEVKIALGFFGLQLVLNAFWSIIFFGLKMPLVAFIEIIILLALIIITILKFHKISKKAALLMVPYALWVGFASILNLSIWLLN